MDNKTMIKLLARSAMIAGIYAAVTISFAPISYGPVQVRISEALTVLPFLWPEAVMGLFVGCIIANSLGGLGIWDIGLGSLATLLAAWLTSKTTKPWLAPLPPVLVNGVIVGGYLSLLYNMPWWSTMAYVAAGQVVACYLLGLPLLHLMLKKRKG
ncbi:MAG TPA: QueT transporter family protein [Clostridia bacterium]|nr:QueT transporter family protein [Clostridia bacterium]